MHTRPIMALPTCFEPFPIVDEEFDSFEINNELEMQLREAEPANFYHDSLNNEE